MAHHCEVCGAILTEDEYDICDNCLEAQASGEIFIDDDDDYPTEEY